MVKACGIVVILNRGGVVPGRAHIFGKDLKQPICDRDEMSAMLSSIAASIQGLDGRGPIHRREPRSTAMEVATRWMESIQQRVGRTQCFISDINSFADHPRAR
jgi:hypothetical protein